MILERNNPSRRSIMIMQFQSAIENSEASALSHLCHRLL
jgi:hypothetical protein